MSASSVRSFPSSPVQGICTVLWILLTAPLISQSQIGALRESVAPIVPPLPPAWTNSLSSPRPTLPPAPEDLVRTESLLRERLLRDPTNLNTVFQLARLELRRGRHDAAAGLLEPLAARRADLAMQLARVCTVQQRPDEARYWASNALAQVSPRLAAATNDAPGLRLLAGRARLLLEQFADAASTVAEGLRHTNRPAYLVFQNEVFLRWTAEARSAPAPNRLAILRQGCAAGVRHPGFLREWILLSQEPGDTAAEARREIVQRVADTNDTSQAALWLGALAARAWEQSQPGEAQRLYLQAVTLAPRNPELLNNAAALLAAHPDPARRDQALEWVETALRLSPDNPEYRDTRGQVLLALDRPALALVDFEAAVGRVANPVATRRAMAQALHRVGRHEEAARQEAAATATGRAPTADWDEPGGP